MAKQTKPRLGRGLSSLIGQPVEVAPQVAQAGIDIRSNTKQTSTIEMASGGLRSISVNEVVPSPFQPRLDPTDADLEPLAASIRSSGVMQPIAVRPVAAGDSRYRTGMRFELIAGERRWRAAQIAGLDHIPALVVELSDQESAEWALVENIQREDLSPIERAEALRKLAERFDLSHALLAERVGLDRSTVTNLIRLTELEAEIKELLGGTLGTGHAKALLGMAPGRERVRIAQLAAKHAWSVRKLEQMASDGVGPSGARAGASAPMVSPHVANIEKQLSDHLATRVRLRVHPSGKKGRITIDFFSVEHFEGLLKSLGLDLES